MEENLKSKMKTALTYLIFIFLWLALCLANCLLLIPRFEKDAISAIGITSGIMIASLIGAILYGAFFIIAAVYGYKKDKKILVWLVLGEGILFLAALTSLGLFLLKHSTGIFDMAYSDISGSLLLKFWLLTIAPFHGLAAFAGSFPLFAFIPVFTAAHIILPIVLLVKLQRRKTPVNIKEK